MNRRVVVRELETQKLLCCDLFLVCPRLKEHLDVDGRLYRVVEVIHRPYHESVLVYVKSLGLGTLRHRGDDRVLPYSRESAIVYFNYEEDAFLREWQEDSDSGFVRRVELV